MPSQLVQVQLLHSARPHGLHGQVLHRDPPEHRSPAILRVSPQHIANEPAGPPGLAEPLTDRETDVPRLIAAGKSNQRIAHERPPAASALWCLRPAAEDSTCLRTLE